MKLTNDQVKHVAKLANLPLTEVEIEKYTEQLSAILSYIEQLQKVDTKNVKPTYNVSMQTNITREDKIYPSLAQDQALQNAQDINNGFFVTKGVFEE